MTAVIAGDTGVARYAAELRDRLVARPEVDVRAYTIGRGPRPPFPALRVRWPLRIVHLAWSTFRWPDVTRALGPGHVVHALDLVPPPTNAPVVVTVHDLLPLRVPALYSRRHRRIARRQAASLARATVVTTTCEATADHITEVTGIERASIVVAPPGVRAPHARPGSPMVGGTYVLAVGSVTPRKGFERLAEAVAALGSLAPRVVIAGPPGWRADAVRSRVTASGAAVTFLGRVDDETLDNLYRNAAAVCHPSTAEGFGIPVLEAMAYGIPVVATDLASTREIVGPKMRLVPVDDVAALSTAIADAVARPPHVDAMVEVGRERARHYTWERTADSIVAAYQRALA